MNGTNKKNDLQRATEKALAVKKAYGTTLMSKANVVGVGAGFCKKDGVQTDKVGLVVMVNKKVPRELLNQEDILPSEIDGVVVDVQEVGEIKAY